MLDLLKNISVTITALTIIASALSAILILIYKVYKNSDRVYHQLIPNGGNSLADQIISIRNSLTISNHRQSLLWSAMSTPYFECDANGCCTYVNDALANLFGLSKEEMLTLGWVRAIVGQAERVRVVDQWMQAVQNKLPYETEYPIQNQTTGEKSIVRATAEHCFDEKKKVLYMFGFIEKLPVELKG